MVVFSSSSPSRFTVKATVTISSRSQLRPPSLHHREHDTRPDCLCLYFVSLPSNFISGCNPVPSQASSQSQLDLRSEMATQQPQQPQHCSNCLSNLRNLICEREYGREVYPCSCAQCRQLQLRNQTFTCPHHSEPRP